MLRDRLVAVGVPDAEARVRAKGRVKRLEDGRVIARKADGKLLHSGPEPQPDRKYTEEEKSRFVEAGPAVTAATRAILDEREKGAPADSGEPANQSMDAIRSRVAGAL